MSLTYGFIYHCWFCILWLNLWPYFCLLLMKMSCILRVAEESLLIAVCFSGSGAIVIIKCLCLCFEVAVSECEISCGYTVEYTSGRNSWGVCMLGKQNVRELNNKTVLTLSWRQCGVYSMADLNGFFWVQNVRAHWPFRYFSLIF